MEPKRNDIEAELLHWMREEPEREDDARFERLALALFAEQYAHCPAYRRLARRRGLTPGRVRCWQEIPAVPTGAFKEFPLRCFDESAEVKTFRTSGTAAAKRGALHLDTLELYEASLRASFRRGVLHGLCDTRITLLVLAPSAREVPESSLSHMFQVLVQELGAPGSGFFVTGGVLQAEALAAACENAAAPLALCGITFMMAQWTAELARQGRRLALPEDARLMETGGFKGRSGAMHPDILYAQLEERLGVPAQRIVNQYGMTELGSQFYDGVLSDPGAARAKQRPPWTRVRLVDPHSGEDAKGDAPGMIQIVDLSNTGSVAAVRTADLGRRRGRGFEVLGRAPGAEARGCSLAAEEMFEGVGA